MSDSGARILRRLSRGSFALLIVLIFAGLASALFNLPPDAPGLSHDVTAELARTGMQSPVTATLLDFRSYDTLLEIAVLLLAVIAARALRRGDPPTLRRDDQILAFLGRVLVPIMILIAAYLLMMGLDTAGGAFQAGAILAAAGVLSILAGQGLPLHGGALPMRVGLAVGLSAFIAVGLAGMLAANAFLDYPQRVPANTVLILELGMSVSVALALIEMFVSVLSRSNPASTTQTTREGKQ